MTGKDRSLSYKHVGVDVAAGEETARLVAGLARASASSDVVLGPGHFAGVYRLPGGYVLAAGCDGVGSKLKVALAVGRLDTVGIDLVAMSVNDVLAVGARPLFFLDYLAVSRLDPGQASILVSGMVEGCRQAGCALLGGETAELPDLYAPGELDLAGFAVGLAREEELVTGEAVQPGDVLLGLASSGLHSNGYTLVRAAVSQAGLSYQDPWPPDPARTVAQVLLEPTRIYTAPVRALLEEVPVHGLCHVTGGGIAGNLVRILPPGCRATVRRGSWPVPPVFAWLATLGISQEEMERVFNMGLGYIAVVPAAEADRARRRLRLAGEEAFVVGEVTRGEREVVLA